MPENQDFENSTQNKSQDQPLQLLCRICHQIEIDNQILLSPCRCSAYVHKSCLENWLTISNLDHCEVCLEPYEIKRRFGSFFTYLGRGMSQNKSRFLLVDLMWFIFSTYLVIIVTSSSNTADCNWFQLGCQISAITLTINGLALATYITWTFFCTRYYRAHWRIWRWKSSRVTLVRVTRRGQLNGGHSASEESLNWSLNDQEESDTSQLFVPTV